MEQIEQKLKEIADFLSNPDFKENHNGDLFTGSAGIALFLFYYSKHSNNELYAEKAMSFLAHSVEEIENKINTDLNHTFCTGLSGICWCIDHLVSQKLIDEDNASILPYFDRYLSNSTLSTLQAANNDFFHGAIGTATYLLKRTHVHEVRGALEQIIELLDHQKKYWKDFYYWTHSIGALSNGSTCNLGLAHGISSINIFLKKAGEKMHSPLADMLLEKSTNFLLDQETASADRLSMFPSYSFAPDSDMGWVTRSRLGWCYGDLGIALAIWQYSHHSRNENLEKKAIEILLFSSKRRNLRENWVNDAGICHGAAGIALIFKRMYVYTKIEEFKEASEFWLQQTLAMAIHEDGYCGYKTDREDPTTSLLDGISGIGLVLLSFISSEEPSWDECLLLS